MTTPDPGLLDEAAETTTHAEPDLSGYNCDPPFLASLVVATRTALADIGLGTDFVSDDDCRSVAQAVILDVVRQGYAVTWAGR